MSPLAGHRGEPRAGDAQPGQPFSHRALVLGENKRGRSRADRRPGPVQGGQLRTGHLLVVERDDIAARRERQQISAAAVVPDAGARAHLGRALPGVGGQHAESDAQADGGLARHPGQLPGADHPDDGRAVAGRGGGADPGRGSVCLIRHPP